ncbi:NeuA CMP-N-acetylneuraminic acid synthetase [Candidatus Nanopelagicaceae bacterium]
MINNLRVLALIPARAGSKGLPGKNTRPLLGKPLINWSIEVALKSKYIDEVVVSTDSLEIAEISKNAGAKIPFIRPEELATDEATSVDVALHALSEIRSRFGTIFDYVVLLEPTSPIRKISDLETMIEKIAINASKFDGIISLGEVREHPAYMKKLDGDRFLNLIEDLPSNSRRQDTERIYFPFGVAYIVKTSTLEDEHTFYPANCTYHIIEASQCYEIDSLQDFVFVESLLEKYAE